MHLANLVIDAGVKQDTLGGGGLSGVDMRRNADIAIALDGSLAGHLIYLPYLNQTAMTPRFTKRQGGGQKRKARRRPGETRCHLETEMRERLVGFGHTVNFFALLHRRTAPFGCLKQLGGQALAHRLLAALACRFTNQRMDKAMRRDGRTSTGTW
jgi:hypothetical protein